MKILISKTCVYISTAVLIAFIALYVYAATVNPNVYNHSGRISIGGDVNVAVAQFDGFNIIIFNQNMPYVGNILGVVDNKIVEHWNAFGIYFWLVSDPSKSIGWWTLMFSLWYPIIFFAVSPTVFIVKKIGLFKKNAKT